MECLQSKHVTLYSQSGEPLICGPNMDYQAILGRLHPLSPHLATYGIPGTENKAETWNFKQPLKWGRTGSGLSSTLPILPFNHQLEFKPVMQEIFLLHLQLEPHTQRKRIAHKGCGNSGSCLLTGYCSSLLLSQTTGPFSSGFSTLTGRSSPGFSDRSLAQPCPGKQGVHPRTFCPP